MWRPIATAPRDGTRILIFVPGEKTFTDSSGTYPCHHVGIHAARWEDEMRRDAYVFAPARDGAWCVGGELWSDELLDIDPDVPTHWCELPEEPE